MASTRKSFSLKIIIQFTMEFKWVAYALITMLVFLCFSMIYFAIWLWQEPTE